jgi:glycosyltransferase involved in cell wall biosynthesis
MGIPAVVSAVGVNNIIIDHGKNGFLSKTNEEWFNFLTQLIIDEPLRKKIGNEGRVKIVKNYSVASNASTFLGLFA